MDYGKIKIVCGDIIYQLKDTYTSSSKQTVYTANEIHRSKS